MVQAELPPRKPLARAEPTGRTQDHLWSIVLAGGEGVRLRPLIRRLYGAERPKQYAALVGSRSLLRHTLDRVALASPLERTVLATCRSHAKYIASEFAGSPAPHVLVQPEDRGTAAGILFPIHWVHWQDREATVAIFPSDHFILEDAPFMGHVLQVAALVSQPPERIILLGARPTEPEAEYGWIEPGETMEWVEASPIRRVRRFWEKPSAERARAFMEAGYLWNTFVLVARASALLEAGRQFLPDLHDRLARITPFLGTEDEPWAIQQAYALAPKANFSQAILQPCPPSLAVSELPTLTWSDWGTPGRVLESLKRAGILPSWLGASHRPA